MQTMQDMCWELPRRATHVLETTGVSDLKVSEASAARELLSPSADAAGHVLATAGVSDLCVSGTSDVRELLSLNADAA